MSLRANDLRNLVDPIFEIDAFKSNIGDDDKIIVLSFTVTSQDPAKDLENFIEIGYDFVLDADVSPGETDSGNYRVFVELERDRHAAENIIELLQGIKLLTNQDMKFRYFKSFRSYDATLENLQQIVPDSIEQYKITASKHKKNNYNSFFENSIVNKITVTENDIITFSKPGIDLKFKIINSGPKQHIYESATGKIMLEQSAISEVLYFTKVIGNYNITKIGNGFIFENQNWAVLLERI